MSLFKLLVLSTCVFAASAQADLCEELFTYSEGQVMNKIDENKALLISQSEIGPESLISDALKNQILDSLSEYGDYGDDWAKAVDDTDDGSATFTIARPNGSDQTYAIIQYFLGDTEVGNIYAVDSNTRLADLGDGDCFSF